MKDANISAAETQINSLFKTALAMYETDNGKFPTTSQGLSALVVKPTSEPVPKKWKRPYLDGQVPNDPWGNAYLYSLDGGQPTFTTYGADGLPGGTGEEADHVGSRGY